MIPMEAVEAAGDVLVYHQRKDIRGCTCGWAEPGRSYPEHQARLALEAAAPYMHSAWDKQRKYDALDSIRALGSDEPIRKRRAAAEKAPYMLNNEGEK